MVSNCCKDQLIVENGDEGTNYYCCRACGNPCSPFDDRVEPKVEPAGNRTKKEVVKAIRRANKIRSWRDTFREKFQINYILNIDGEWPKEWISVKEIESFIQSTIDEQVKKDRDRITQAIIDILTDGKEKPEGTLFYFKNEKIQKIYEFVLKENL